MLMSTLPKEIIFLFKFCIKQCFSETMDGNLISIWFKEEEKTVIKDTISVMEDKRL